MIYETPIPTTSECGGSVVRGFCSGITCKQPYLFCSDFQGRCIEKLVHLADAARDGKKHEEAIRYYSDAMSLDPTNLNEILLKRGNVVRITFPAMSNLPR